MKCEIRFQDEYMIVTCPADLDFSYQAGIIGGTRVKESLNPLLDEWEFDPMYEDDVRDLMEEFFDWTGTNSTTSVPDFPPEDFIEVNLSINEDRECTYTVVILRKTVKETVQICQSYRAALTYLCGYYNHKGSPDPSAESHRIIAQCSMTISDRDEETEFEAVERQVISKRFWAWLEEKTFGNDIKES